MITKKGINVIHGDISEMLIDMEDWRDYWNGEFRVDGDRYFFGTSFQPLILCAEIARKLTGRKLGKSILVRNVKYSSGKLSDGHYLLTSENGKNSVYHIRVMPIWLILAIKRKMSINI